MFVPPNEVIYNEDFLKDVRIFPKRIQNKLSALIELLRENPFDSRLHTKPLGPPLQGVFSFRITRDYRVGFEFSEPQVIRLLTADKRDKIYKRLRKKL